MPFFTDESLEDLLFSNSPNVVVPRFLAHALMSHRYHDNSCTLFHEKELSSLPKIGELVMLAKQLMQQGDKNALKELLSFKNPRDENKTMKDYLIEDVRRTGVTIDEGGVIHGELTAIEKEWLSILKGEQETEQEDNRIRDFLSNGQNVGSVDATAAQGAKNLKDMYRGSNIDIAKELQELDDYLRTISFNEQFSTNYSEIAVTEADAASFIAGFKTDYVPFSGSPFCNNREMLAYIWHAFNDPDGYISKDAEWKETKTIAISEFFQECAKTQNEYGQGSQRCTHGQFNALMMTLQYTHTAMLLLALSQELRTCFVGALTNELNNGSYANADKVLYCSQIQRDGAVPPAIMSNLQIALAAVLTGLPADHDLRSIYDFPTQNVEVIGKLIADYSHNIRFSDTEAAKINMSLDSLEDLVLAEFIRSNGLRALPYYRGDDGSNFRSFTSEILQNKPESLAIILQQGYRPEEDYFYDRDGNYQDGLSWIMTNRPGLLESLDQPQCIPPDALEILLENPTDEKYQAYIGKHIKDFDSLLQFKNSTAELSWENLVTINPQYIPYIKHGNKFIDTAAYKVAEFKKVKNKPELIKDLIANKDYITLQFLYKTGHKQLINENIAANNYEAIGAIKSGEDIIDLYTQLVYVHNSYYERALLVAANYRYNNEPYKFSDAVLSNARTTLVSNPSFDADNPEHRSYAFEILLGKITEQHVKDAVLRDAIPALVSNSSFDADKPEHRSYAFEILLGKIKNQSPKDGALRDAIPALVRHDSFDAGKPEHRSYAFETLLGKIQNQSPKNWALRDAIPALVRHDSFKADNPEHRSYAFEILLGKITEQHVKDGALRDAIPALVRHDSFKADNPEHRSYAFEILLGKITEQHVKDGALRDAIPALVRHDSFKADNPEHRSYAFEILLGKITEQHVKDGALRDAIPALVRHDSFKADNPEHRSYAFEILLGKITEQHVKDGALRDAIPALVRHDSFKADNPEHRSYAFEILLGKIQNQSPKNWALSDAIPALVSNSSFDAGKPEHRSYAFETLLGKIQNQSPKDWALRYAIPALVSNSSFDADKPEHRRYVEILLGKIQNQSPKNWALRYAIPALVSNSSFDADKPEHRSYVEILLGKITEQHVKDWALRYAIPALVSNSSFDADKPEHRSYVETLLAQITSQGLAQITKGDWALRDAIPALVRHDSFNADNPEHRRYVETLLGKIQNQSPKDWALRDAIPALVSNSSFDADKPEHRSYVETLLAQITSQGLAQITKGDWALRYAIPALVRHDSFDADKPEHRSYAFEILLGKITEQHVKYWALRDAIPALVSHLSFNADNPEHRRYVETLVGKMPWYHAESETLSALVNNPSFKADNPRHRNYLYKLSYLNNDTLPVELDGISDKYSWEYWCQRNLLSSRDITGAANLHYGIRLGVTAAAFVVSSYLVSTALNGIANGVVMAAGTLLLVNLERKNLLSSRDITGAANLHYGIRLGVTAVAIAASFYLASTALNGIANGFVMAVGTLLLVNLERKILTPLFNYFCNEYCAVEIA